MNNLIFYCCFAAHSDHEIYESPSVAYASMSFEKNIEKWHKNTQIIEAYKNVTFRSSCNNRRYTKTSCEPIYMWRYLAVKQANNSLNLRHCTIYYTRTGNEISCLSWWRQSRWKDKVWWITYIHNKWYDQHYYYQFYFVMPV